MSDLVAKYDEDMAGVRQIEVGCWPGEVESFQHKGTGLLVVVPMRYLAEQQGLIWWGVTAPSKTTLLVAPRFIPGLPTSFLGDTTPPPGPMRVYVPQVLASRRGRITVVNQRRF